MSPTITGKERDALYLRVVVRLGGIDGVYQAVDEEEWDAAQKLAQEFSDLLRLLWEDLGWGERDDESLTLNTPPDVLTRAAGSLRDLARDDRAHYEGERTGVQERVDEAVCLEEICERLMSAAAGRDAPAAG